MRAAEHRRVPAQACTRATGDTRQHEAAAEWSASGEQLERRFRATGLFFRTASRTPRSGPTSSTYIEQLDAGRSTATSEARPIPGALFSVRPAQDAGRTTCSASSSSRAPEPPTLDPDALRLCGRRTAHSPNAAVGSAARATAGRCRLPRPRAGGRVPTYHAGARAPAAQRHDGQLTGSSGASPRRRVTDRPCRPTLRGAHPFLVLERARRADLATRPRRPRSRRCRKRTPYRPTGQNVFVRRRNRGRVAWPRAWRIVPDIDTPGAVVRRSGAHRRSQPEAPSAAIRASHSSAARVSG